MANYAKFTGSIIDDRTGLAANDAASLFYSSSKATPNTSIPIGSTSTTKDLGSSQLMLFGTGSTLKSGYTFVSFAVIVKNSKGTTLASQTFTKDPTGNSNSGYWNLTSTLSGTSQQYPATIEVVLHVRTPIPTYTLTYNANGGSGAPAKQTFKDGTTVTISATRPTKSGHEFKGWAKTQTATTAQYTPGQIGVTFTGNTTLYAVWELITSVEVTVTFNPNGGSCEEKTRKVTSGEEYGDLPAVFRDGYVFGGWYLGSTRIYGYTVVTNKTNHTLVASWSAITPGTITFNPNGGTGEPAAISVNTSGSTQIPRVYPTKSGYIFGGWATSATALGATYFAGKGYTISGSLVLYAVWKTAASYAGYIAASQRRYIIGGEIVSTVSGLPDGVMLLPSLLGYVYFASLVNIDQNGHETPIDTSHGVIFVAPDNGGVHISGKIGEANITIKSSESTFDGPSQSLGLGASTPYNFAHRIAIGVDVARLENEGLEMYGWFCGNSGTGSTEEIRVSTDGWLHYGDTYVDTITYAQEHTTNTLQVHHIIVPLVRYKQIVVAFYTEGGTVSPSYKLVNYSKPYGTLPTPIRSGYTFGGWYDASGARVTEATTVTDKTDHILTARWSKNALALTIAFDPRGGVCATSSKTITEGQPIGALPNATREGYTFDGWFSSAYSGTQVTATTVPDRSMIVYAHWASVKYTITFDPNGGTCNTATKTVNAGAKIGSLPTAKLSGKNFEGWYTSLEGGSKVTSFTVANTSMTLYARFKTNAPTPWVTVKISD